VSIVFALTSGVALAQGSTLDEVLETIVIAGMIAESSSLSVALREYRKVEARAPRDG